MKPKAREWEKHKVPWMDELKASQAKKTSPGHTIGEPKSPASLVDENAEMSKSISSSSFKATTNNHHQTTTVELRSQSVEVRDPKPADPMSKSMTAVSRISINEKPDNNHIAEPSARTRSISPGRRPPSVPVEGPNRVADLEDRIVKLERIVINQGAAIDDLTKQLVDESTKVKVLKMQLEKYAQCVTQVWK